MEELDFVKRLKLLPALRALREATEFPVAATVETDLARYEEAFRYCTSARFKARWYRSVRMRDERVLWLFEDEEDAILFVCRMGGDPHCSIRLSDWLCERENTRFGQTGRI